MSPEEQRIAIAKACGWEEFTPSPSAPVTDCNLKKDGAVVWYARHLPDYLNDLNAMHKAEKMLSDREWVGYIDELKRLLGAHANTYRCVRAKIHANAAQRAEAFLRAKGLWKETPDLCPKN